MRTYFSLTAAALIFAALCGAALSWDGSVYLFQVLDKQEPFVPHNRLVNIPLHWPVLITSYITSDLPILRTVFGLSYVAVPLLALACSWWIVRQRARSLFVWAALGIGLATLPGQFIFVSEANIAVHLFWPVLLAILVRIPRQQVPLVLILTAFVFVSHPTATLLLACASAAAVAVGLRHKADRRKMLLWGLGFGLVTAAVTARFLLLRTDYEDEQLSWATIRWTFDVSMSGVPIKALASAGLAAMVVLLAPLARRRLPARFTLTIYAVELVSLVIAAAFLLLWAMNPHLWKYANKFTFWAPFTSLLFMGVATLETLTIGPRMRQENEPDWGHRLRTMQIVAAVFLVIVSTQSLVWLGLSNQLRQTMAQSRWDCVSTAPVAWIDRSPLNQFATPYYSILLQGREPQKVVLTGDGCTKAPLVRGATNDSFTARLWGTGWFNLASLGDRLSSEDDVPQGCVFYLASGWHTSETDGKAWWRWSDGRDAQINVLTDKELVVELNGSIQVTQPPDRIRISANQVDIGATDVTWQGLRHFDSAPITLQPGKTVIRLAVQKPPIDVDGRYVGLSVAGLNITPVEETNTCERRP